MQNDLQYATDRVLFSTNWTGLTLADLIEAGRITPTPENIRPWVRHEMPEPETLEQVKFHEQVLYCIIDTVNRRHDTPPNLIRLFRP